MILKLLHCYLVSGFLILIVYLSLSDLITSPESIKNSCLVEIEKLLRLNGKTLKDFVSMPSLDFSELGEFENILLASELMYDKVEMLAKHKEYYANLNFAQKTAYDCIVNAVDGKLGGFFFVDGYGCWNKGCFTILPLKF